MKKFLFALLGVFLLAEKCFAGSFSDSLSKYGDFLYKDISMILCEHDYDIYVPLYAWHNRLTYDREHIDKYNEEPWGFGVGISHFDNDDNWSGLYAMGFKDSNSYFETFFGYAYQWNWTYGDEHQWRAGAGYTLGLTQRHEYAYIPVPLPLPLIGVGYRNFNVQAAYVPGIKNDGNVLFVFSRFQF